MIEFILTSSALLTFTTLISLTLITSLIDCINPFAMAQQFVLQGMVKKKNHIWYYIIAIGLTNLIGGIFAYYGLISSISNMLNNLIAKYGNVLYLIELTIGILFFILFGVLIHKLKAELMRKNITRTEGVEEVSEEGEIVEKIKSVTPLALIALGVGATISEIITALPYITYLTLLYNYQLGFIEVVLLLLVYNLVFILPLVVMYFMFTKARGKFDKIYIYMKDNITKITDVLVTLLVGVIAFFLVYHSVNLLM